MGFRVVGLGPWKLNAAFAKLTLWCKGGHEERGSKQNGDFGLGIQGQRVYVKGFTSLIT